MSVFFVIKWPSRNEDKVYDVRMNTISQMLTTYKVQSAVVY